MVQASEYKPYMKQPSRGNASPNSSVPCCLKINWKLRVSTGIFIFLAYICKTDVRKPCGKKNAEIQYILGRELRAYLKK